MAAESEAKVDEDGFDRASDYLARTYARRSPDMTGSGHVRDQHRAMLVLFALSLPRPGSFERVDANENNRHQEIVRKHLSATYEQRKDLPVYGRLLLTLALHNQSDSNRASAVLNEVLKLIERDDERNTAHVPAGSSSYWHSWNSEVEINAWLLRAIVAIDPQNAAASQVVNWLALNRSHGRFWRSTQDTALAVTAMSEYMISTGANVSERTVWVRLDAGPPTSIRVTRDDILGLETVLVVPGGKPLSPGRHEVTVERTGTEAMHYAMHVDYLRQVALGAAHGNGLSVTRRYFRVKSLADIATDGTNRFVNADVAIREDREPVAMDDKLAVGDLIEVELTINSDEDYEYVAFEDMKPAGCEAVQLRSDHSWRRDLWTNVELRDDRVVFFAADLGRGVHVLRYKLRAETPGRFHALPARGFAMYAPEIQAQSDELRLGVMD